MANEPRVFIVDPVEIDRYARAIARIADKGHAAGSSESAPCIARNTGSTASRQVMKLDTGLPGSPMNRASPAA